MPHAPHTYNPLYGVPENPLIFGESGSLGRFNVSGVYGRDSQCDRVLNASVETSALPRLLRGYAVETPFKRISSSALCPLGNSTLGQRPYIANALRLPKFTPPTI